MGFKPAGGISTAKQALVYLALIEDELGDEWLNNEYFRFGASRSDGWTMQFVTRLRLCVLDCAERHVLVPIFYLGT